MVLFMIGLLAPIFVFSHLPSNSFTVFLGCVVYGWLIFIVLNETFKFAIPRKKFKVGPKARKSRYHFHDYDYPKSGGKNDR